MRWSRYAVLMALLPIMAAPSVACGASESDGDSGMIALLGEKVKGAAGEDMGAVVNVLVDPDGRVRAAVIDFGGFLGVGSRKIAVDWRFLRFQPDNPKAPVVLLLDRAAVQAAPEYKPAHEPAQPVAILGSPSSAPAGH